jgi:hypothetical protein
VITTGYLNGPLTAANAQAVQGDPTTGSHPASIILGSMYWPAGIPHARNSFANGTMPYRCPAGQSLVLPYYEAAALVAAGAAEWL